MTNQDPRLVSVLAELCRDAILSGTFSERWHLDKQLYLLWDANDAPEGLNDAEKNLLFGMAETQHDQGLAYVTVIGGEVRIHVGGEWLGVEGRALARLVDAFVSMSRRGLIRYGGYTDRYRSCRRELTGVFMLTGRAYELADELKRIVRRPSQQAPVNGVAVDCEPAKKASTFDELAVEDSKRHTQTLKKALRLAAQIASSHGQNWIGMEHLIAAGVKIDGSLESFSRRWIDNPVIGPGSTEVASSSDEVRQENRV